MKRRLGFAVLSIALLGVAGCGGTPAAKAPSSQTTAAAYVDAATGVKSLTGVARDVERLPGVKGATVLLQGTTAYVGVYLVGPESAAPEEKKHPTGRMVPVPYGNKNRNETSRQSQGAMQSGPRLGAMYEAYPRVDSRQGTSSTDTGDLDAKTRTDITRLIQGRTGATQVLITAKTRDVAMLRGYAYHIESGGSLAKYGMEFRNSIRSIFPQS